SGPMAFAIMRMKTSGPPPGGCAMMVRTGFDGYSWAGAGAMHKALQHAATQIVVFIDGPPRISEASMAAVLMPGQIVFAAASISNRAWACNGRLAERRPRRPACVPMARSDRPPRRRRRQGEHIWNDMKVRR